MAKKKSQKAEATTAKNILNETEIVVVLDRSGSMDSIEQATVDGFNKFLQEQQNSEGTAFLTLVQFDDRYEVNYVSKPIKDVKPLILGETYIPRGSTALLDAIGKTIEELKTDRDIVFVIITDGAENSSKTYKREAIFKMIETLGKENWKFLFLAANQDAIAAGNSIGIVAANSMTYTATTHGANQVFSTISKKMSSYRGSKLRSMARGETVLCSANIEELSFSDKDREEQK